jgi:hypothetical protein
VSSILVRTLVLFALVGLAVGLARVATRWQRPVHATPSLEGLGVPAGLVIFTSTDCANCRAALGVAADTGAPVREITYELEPMLFRQAGVEAVPLTVVMSNEGSIVATFAGVPRQRGLRRALRRAGF